VCCGVVVLGCGDVLMCWCGVGTDRVGDNAAAIPCCAAPPAAGLSETVVGTDACSFNSDSRMATTLDDVLEANQPTTQQQQQHKTTTRTHTHGQSHTFIKEHTQNQITTHTAQHSTA
jgi:hypothetical protein